MADNGLGEVEIMAYVDGQVDLDERLRIEATLSLDPERAAQVMGELQARTALKLLAGSEVPVRSAIADLLEPASPRPDAKPHRRRAVSTAVLGLLIMSGLLVSSGNAGAPSYVDNAVASHRTALLRATMDSQLEAPQFDAREIWQKTSVAMPKLPGDWAVTDVQLFPYERDTAVLVAVRTPSGEVLSLFAIHQRSGAPKRPDAIRAGQQSVAFWRKGGTSYALTGNDDVKSIDASAETLARLWNT